MLIVYVILFPIHSQGNIIILQKATQQLWNQPIPFGCKSFSIYAAPPFTYIDEPPRIRRDMKLFDLVLQVLDAANAGHVAEGDLATRATRRVLSAGAARHLRGQGAPLQPKKGDQWGQKTKSRGP